MKSKRDWYFRKMSNFWQELLDDAANAKRPTKKERRNAKRVNDKAKQHGLKIDPDLHERGHNMFGYVLAKCTEKSKV